MTSLFVGLVALVAGVFLGAMMLQQNIADSCHDVGAFSIAHHVFVCEPKS